MSLQQSQYALYELRQQIISGALPAGTKLRASHLANTMDASRTPIAEALMKLAEEGLLVRDRSGFTVRTFKIADVYDAIALRGMLEGAAVQRAAERGVSQDVFDGLTAQLAAMDQMIERESFGDYDHLNEAFHKSLIEASQSEILIEEVIRSYRYPFAGPSAFPSRGADNPRFTASIVAGQAQHHQIVQALENRQGSRVFHLMCEHARLAFPNIREAMAQSRSLPQLAMVAG